MIWIFWKIWRRVGTDKLSFHFLVLAFTRAWTDALLSPSRRSPSGQHSSMVTIPASSMPHRRWEFCFFFAQWSPGRAELTATTILWSSSASGNKYSVLTRCWPSVVAHGTELAVSWIFCVRIVSTAPVIRYSRRRLKHPCCWMCLAPWQTWAQLVERDLPPRRVLTILRDSHNKYYTDVPPNNFTSFSRQLLPIQNIHAFRSVWFTGISRLYSAIFIHIRTGGRCRADHRCFTPRPCGWNRNSACGRSYRHSWKGQ